MTHGITGQSADTLVHRSYGGITACACHDAAQVCYIHQVLSGGTYACMVLGVTIRCMQVEEEFVAAIRGEGSIRRTTFEQGVRYMEFTEAVTRSIQSGCTVKLPLLT